MLPRAGRMLCLVPLLLSSSTAFRSGAPRGRQTARPSTESTSSPPAAWSNERLPQTWSNRLGRTLTPITQGIWAAERPFVWNGIDVGGRMAVARMCDGSLWVHSPVNLDPALEEGLASLGGGVGHVVSPNFEHLKYAQQWASGFPEAHLHACPGLPEKMPELGWRAGGTRRGEVPESWAETMEVAFLDCEVNPFTGNPFFNEVVFFHVPSKALFVTDLWWNYPSGPRPNFRGETGAEGTGRVHDCSKVPIPLEDCCFEGGAGVPMLPAVDVPVGTKLWKFGMDRIYLPFYKRFMVGSRGNGRRERFEATVERILGWEAEVLVPCHGDVLRGKEAIRKALTDHLL